MTDTLRKVPQAEGAGTLVLASGLVALAGFAALQGVASSLAGAFEYPLDDVYIHLAMAEGIAAGGYGVNPGEYAAADSSILYPALLVPFAGSAWQRYLPFLWNMAGAVAMAALWGAALARSAFPAGGRWALALVGPLALNFVGVAYTGMEHSLQGAAALALVLGLWHFLSEGRIGALLVVGVLVGPLLRFEGLALSGLACLVLAAHRRSGTAVLLGLGAALPVAAFVAFLQAKGLGSLPASVQAKTALAIPEAGPVIRAIATPLQNLADPRGVLLAGLTVLCLGLPAGLAEMRKTPRGWLLGVVGLAGAAHLLAGQVGGMSRYEIYIVAALTMALVLASAGLSRRAGAWGAAGVGLVCLCAGAVYGPDLWRSYLWNPQSVHLQQAQMARFVDEYLDAPVAVNDLGWVAWQNDHYVVDLVGLGSLEALKARLEQQDPSWATAVMARHNAQLAMIYDSWFQDIVGPDWVRLGTLSILAPRGRLGGNEVAFYASSAEAAVDLRKKLEAFAPSLPPGAVFTFATNAQGGL
ncbi:hypothetical protein CKO11_07205 [Rhodobacter sp. TJ_12]|uniref:hypothetical protein n=1 Tax=Rhodobacter sp. TJ_12 TaxID=2029399 RepID=UPI001CBE8BD1|nr:hypothetical protein [Rhodobacter sp. TJ_12]MBZ4022242.1 hypothetical protein [Rhodobacter sp. TJ_12]